MKVVWNETQHDKTNKMTCAPSEDSDEPVWSVFAVRMKKHWALATHKAHSEDSGWSESSLCTLVILQVLLCCSSNVSDPEWHLRLKPCKIDVDISYVWALSWENLFLPYANNKGADHPAHPRSLISAFVVHCLDSIISLLSIAEISRP